MGERALKIYLAAFLHRLGRKESSSGRYTYADLAEVSGVSRSTINNWTQGHATPTETNLGNLARGMRELIVRAGVPDEGLSDGQLLEQLRQKLDQADPAAAEIQVGFFRYGLMCNPPLPRADRAVVGRDADVADSFLGRVFPSFMDLRTGWRVSHEPIEVLGVREDQCDVLVGLFPLPRRLPNWDFIRTPLQVPLNGLVLRQDLSLFHSRVLPVSRAVLARDTVEAVLQQFEDWLWGAADRGQAAPSFDGDVAPITAAEEVGRDFLQDVHGFKGEVLTRFGLESLGPDTGSDPGAFYGALMSHSAVFQKSAKADNFAGGEIGLPVVVADELTILEVAREVRKAGKTDPILLRYPSDTTLQADRDLRPRFSVSIGVRRERADRGVVPASYSDLKNAFDEFLWSRTGSIASQYVNLYRKLVARYDDVLGPLGSLYLLRWLSIDLAPDDMGDDPNARASGLRVSAPVPPETQNWSSILHAAKATILDDRSLSDRIGAALMGAASSVVQ